jgi:hypothetical protein
MQEVTLRRIAFGSFIKLCVAIFFALGLSAGVGMLILSFLGANVYVHLNQAVVTGPPAGIIALVVLPPLSALLGILAAIVAYLPYRLLTQLTDGITLRTASSEAIRADQ